MTDDEKKKLANLFCGLNARIGWLESRLASNAVETRIAAVQTGQMRQLLDTYAKENGIDLVPESKA